MTPEFVQLQNLAAESFGAKVIYCTDDFFAPVQNLLKPGRGIFIEDKYTEYGKWMDGNRVENEQKDTIFVLFN